MGEILIGAIDKFPAVECLNEHEFINLQHARILIETFREDYNQLSPHSSLDYLAPIEFAEKLRGPMGARGV
jgi:putative transposase